MSGSSVSLQAISQRRNFSSETSPGDRNWWWWWVKGGGGCRGLIGRDGGDDAVAISASRHSSLAA